MTTANRWADDPVIRLLVLYHSLGWITFPCRYRDKVPLTRNGCKDATRDPKSWNAWCREHRQFNPAIATGAGSGIFVLDVDAGGDETIAMLEREHGPLPIGPLARTGSGGSHRFFAHPGVPVKNSAKELGPGLDVRGEGGYVVAPPSIHPTGGRYLWTRAPRQGEPLPQAPAWLVAKVRKPEAPKPQRVIVGAPSRVAPGDRRERYALAAMWAEIESVERAADGEGRAVCNRAAFALGRLVGGGVISHEQAYQRLTEAIAGWTWRRANDPARMLRAIATGLRDGSQHPRTWADLEHAMRRSA